MLTTLEKVLLLQDVPLLRELPTDALAHVAAVAQEEHLPDGVLWRAGDPADAVYFVKDGMVGLEAGTRPLMTAGPGSDLGAASLVLQAGLRDTTARVLRPVTLLRVPRDEFLEIMSEHPEAARGLLAALGTRLTGALRRLDAGPPPA
jgi:NTE family protein